MKPTNEQDLAAWLTQRRGDLTFEEFADLTGVSKSTLQRYESRQTPISAGSRLMLAHALTDFPKWALPRDAAGKSVAAQYPPYSPEPHRVEEPRATYDALMDSDEFERALRRSVAAKAIVISGLTSHGLTASEHVTLQQTLVLLLVRGDLKPAALVDLLQWYAFEVQGRGELKREAAPPYANADADTARVFVGHAGGGGENIGTWE